MDKSGFKRRLKALLDDGINLVLISLVTGVFAGVVVTFYNILAGIGEGVSVTLYTLLRDNPAFIPLLFLGLAAGAIVIGTVVKLVPMVRGSGIPQIEGAARGIVGFKWYVAMCTMFAASLACIFMGLSAGAEGPSVEMGGCAGEASGVLLKRDRMTRRLQIAAGSSAGFAVAFNAPVTGLIFAMEEAFRSFSPKVFICAAFGVASALVTRNAIRPALGYGVGFAFDSFIFPENFSFSYCLWVIPAAIISALAGVGFYFAVFAMKKLYKRITFLKGAGKFLIPFLAAGAFGLITAYAMGGGHAFIEDLGTHGTGSISIERVFGISVAASIAIVVVLKFISAVLITGCGVPCGVFVPMLAVGAGLGGLLSVVFNLWGMPGEFTDYLIIICMAVFFTTVVKAPVTGIVMMFELTGRFTNFLPALIGVAIGYFISMLFKTQPLYERSLADYIDERGIYKDVVKHRVSVTIQPGSKADGAPVRSVIWPANGLIVQLTDVRGVIKVPDGETVLAAGETLIFECETDSLDSLTEYLYQLVGKP